MHLHGPGYMRADERDQSQSTYIDSEDLVDVVLQMTDLIINS